MSERALFYAMVLVFLIGSIALFFGLVGESILPLIIGFLGWIAAIALLVLWFIRRRNIIATE